MGIGQSCNLYPKLLILLCILYQKSLFLGASTTTPLQTPHRNAATLEISTGGDGVGGDDTVVPPPSPSPPSPRPSDFPNLKQYNAYLVIQRFKNTITCDAMNVTATWVGARPCNYAGFYCDSPPDSPTIASVDFNGFGLCAPTLAGFLDQLLDLALFHANSNNFSGTVPDLTALPYLYELDLSNNKLSGAFPANVLPLSDLTFLDLRFNSFTGAAPAQVFLLSQLDVLFMNNNNLSQQLPAELGSSTVGYLTLANNGFTGPIPRSIGNASATLIEVLFLNNRLCGCLPYEIGLLSNATVFDAGNNLLTGTIPLSFGCLKKVEQLNFAGNQLYGEVPDLVCQLAKVGKLENLSLSGNYFTSVGHSCWALIKSKVLDVRQNCIPWLPEQRRAAECAWFFWHHAYCPNVYYIPCIPHHTWPWPWPGPGAQSSLDKRPTVAASPAYMAYKALHRRHGG